MVRIGLLTLFIISFIRVSAQKPAVDFAAIDQWPSVDLQSGSLSNDGKFYSYVIENRPVGGKTLVVGATEGGWRREYSNVTSGTFADDGMHFLFQGAGDTLWIARLGTDSLRGIAQVMSWRLSSRDLLVLRMRDDKGRLAVCTLNGDRQRTFEDVHNYALDHKGETLLVNRLERPGGSELLELVGLDGGEDQVIWHNRDTGYQVRSMTFSNDDQKLVFVESEGRKAGGSKNIWYYERGKGMAVALLDSKEIESSAPRLKINDQPPFFDREGDRVFFSLSKIADKGSGPAREGIDVYNYKDELLPGEETTLRRMLDRRDFLTVINIQDNLGGGRRYVRLETDSQAIIARPQYKGYVGKYLVVEELRGTDRRYRMRQDSLPVIYRISVDDGHKDRIRGYVKYTERQTQNYFSSSDGGRFLLWFSIPEHAYFSYELETGRIRNISGQIPVTLFDERGANGRTLPSTDPTPAGPWLKGDTAVILYDNRDIWEVDPRGEHKPVNITHGYGRQHNLRFGIVPTDSRGFGDVIDGDKGLLLSAFDMGNKYNGFYRGGQEADQDPVKLSMGPYIAFLSINQVHYEDGLTLKTPVKARDADVWLSGRCSAISVPNIYVTRDFKAFAPLSDLQPQAGYNWLTAELVKWQMTDGKWSAGVLYKPENFDPGKKYPVIFTFYKRSSDVLYMFPPLQYSHASINVAYFVSRGYVVFVPDIYYEVNEIGKSVVNSVVSAALYLTKRYPWIDARRMGVSAQSFGGYEVNYLVTHTHMFAAASECCGVSDFVSDYGDINHKEDFKWKSTYYRLNATLWQRPEMWIENSPIFKADKVTTPLLILHNRLDPSVPFNQGIELYTALRQLHKRAWLLQYDGEGHGVNTAENSLDFTVRLNQFFGYYLMHKPPPRWMTTGILPEQKGTETGLEIDSSGRKP